MQVGDYPVDDDGTITYEGNTVGVSAAFDLAQNDDTIPLKVWRDGKMIDVNLPVKVYNDDYAQGNQYDVLPPYYIYGGLVFTAALARLPEDLRPGLERLGRTRPDLRTGLPPSRGPEALAPAAGRARLDPRRRRSTPTSATRGQAMVDKINGVRIDQLSDVPKAFAAANGPDAIIEFLPDHHFEVIRKDDAEKANPDILAHLQRPRAKPLMNRFLLSFSPVAACWRCLPSRCARRRRCAAEKAADGDSGAFAWENADHPHRGHRARNTTTSSPGRAPSSKVYKSGVVVDGHQIITTAEGLPTRPLIRLQEAGRRPLQPRPRGLDRLPGQPRRASPPTRTDFWTGLQPAKLADPVPITGQVRILRWRDDQLENRQGDIERHDGGQLGAELRLRARAENRLHHHRRRLRRGGHGRATSSSASPARRAATPSPPMPVLVHRARSSRRAQAKTYTGLGYFDFTWDPAENPLNLDYLKLPGPARGVIVKETGLKPGVASLVKPHDVLLQIDGFDIDAEGNYADPAVQEALPRKSLLARQVGRHRLPVQDLARRQGNGHHLQAAQGRVQRRARAAAVLRPGARIRPRRRLRLRAADRTPTCAVGARPGASARPSASPTTNIDKVTPERPQRVVLSQVLPDEVNIGYEEPAQHGRRRDQRHEDQANLRHRHRAEIAASTASTSSSSTPGEPIQQAVLDASELDEANQEIMARYHIPADHVLGWPRSQRITEPPAPANCRPRSVASVNRRPTRRQRGSLAFG